MFLTLKSLDYGKPWLSPVDFLWVSCGLVTAKSISVDFLVAPVTGCDSKGKMFPLSQSHLYKKNGLVADLRPFSLSANRFDLYTHLSSSLLGRNPCLSLLVIVEDISLPF